MVRSHLQNKPIAAVSAPAANNYVDFDYQTELRKIWYKKLLDKKIRKVLMP